MSNYAYFLGAVVLVLGFVFRKQLSGVGSFLSSTAHAFATEYNDVYTKDNEEKEE